MAEFRLDTSALRRALQVSPELVARGADNALTDIKNDWVRDSRDIVPKDTHNLQQQIHGDIQGSGLDGYIEVKANAVRESGGSRFNYGYYIHEDRGKAVTGEKKFLDKPAEENIDKWGRWLAKEIEDELRRAGW